MNDSRDFKKEYDAFLKKGIFGKEENTVYFERKGAYIIPIKGEEIGVVETPKGFFLLGGGIDSGETDKQCIIRECIEGAGSCI